MHKIFVIFMMLPFLWMSHAFAEEPQRRLSISGSATIAVIPDRANIEIGVIVENKDAGAAMNELSKEAQKLIDKLKDFGINEKDMQTSRLSLNPAYDEDRSRINGYVAKTTLSVDVEANETLSDLLGELSDFGMNNMGGISFYASNSDTLEQTAMAEAVKNAKAQADILAEAAGMEIGMPISIDYSQQNTRPLRMDTKMMGRSVMEDISMPVESGEIEINAMVRVTYELLTP